MLFDNGEVWTTLAVTCGNGRETVHSCHETAHDDSSVMSFFVEAAV